MTRRGPTVRFESRVRDGLGMEIFPDSQERLPRGAAAGGILLGRQSPEEIVVEDFEPVLSEHSSGTSYVLSDDDLHLLEESVKWFRSIPDGALEILGFYRTQDPPDFSWNERDEEVMRCFFPETGSLLLLFKPLPGRHIAAEFYVIDEGKLRPASDAAAFPLDEPVEIALLSTEVPPAEDTQPQWEETPAPALEPPRWEEPLSEAPVMAEEPVRLEEPARVEEPVHFEEEAPLLAAAEIGGRETRPSERHQLLPPATRPREREVEEVRDRSWLWVAALVALTLVGAVLGYRSVGPPQQAQPAPPQPASQQRGPDAKPAPPAAPPETAPDTKPAPSSTPAAVEPAKPIVSPAMEQGIQRAIARWQRAIRSGDPDLIADCYAAQLDRYFGQRNSSSAKVRRAAMRSVAHYGRPAILRVSGLSILPVSDDRAIATFRKHWQTSGPKVFAGEEQERMALVRLRDVWKIASEEEIKVYWTQRPR